MPHAPSEYYLLDVFTDRAFAGNPLAVFPATDGLEAARMQAIANELNLSETVFVGAPTAAQRFPIRIFTPTLELPFAGHPLVGTAHLLATLGLADRHRPLRLAAGVGELEVRFDGELAWFTTSRPHEIQDSPLDRATAAELLGLEAHRVAVDPVIASCGLPYHLIELDSLETLARAVPSAAAWARHVSPSGVEQVYLHVPLDGEDGIRARMFSTEGDIREDPATGSAAAALAGTLARRRPEPGRWQWRIDQGVEMGRPSRLNAEAERDARGDTAIRIGGRAVLVGEGRLRL